MNDRSAPFQDHERGLGYARAAVRQSGAHLTRGPPESVDLLAYRELGVHLARSGRNEDAESFYLQALRIDAEDAETLRRLGQLMLVVQRADEGLEHLRRAREVDPENAHGRLLLGFALVASGNPEDGLVEIEESDRLQPDQEGTVEYLGVALAACGRLDEAVAAFEKAVELVPEDGLESSRLARDRIQKRLVDALGKIERQGSSGSSDSDALTNARKRIHVLEERLRRSGRSLSAIEALTKELLFARAPQLTDPERALALAREAQERFGPLDPGVGLLRSVAEFELGARERARQTAIQAVESATRILGDGHAWNESVKARAVAIHRASVASGRQKEVFLYDRVELQVLFVRVEDSEDPESTQARVGAARERILSGEPFGDLVEEMSDDHREEGGLLPLQTVDSIRSSSLRSFAEEGKVGSLSPVLAHPDEGEPEAFLLAALRSREESAEDDPQTWSWIGMIQWGVFQAYSAEQSCQELLGRTDTDDTPIGEAVDRAREACALIPEQPSFRSTLGLALCRAGEFEEALRELALAEKVNRSWSVPVPPARYLLPRALCFAHLGRSEDASAAFEEAQRAGVEHEGDLELLEEVRELIEAH